MRMLETEVEPTGLSTLCGSVSTLSKARYDHQPVRTLPQRVESPVGSTSVSSSLIVPCLRQRRELAKPLKKTVSSKR
ncbi:hypothetical protein Y032_0002g638 [Ancylostoma ceylanicum]|uniref:Uncharacterized protein n=1 Tax=Ancylostoma ceylanicum TaxID=53326 RepID=A0A016W003_9BILA|nr:hypothetical protein Y032_0002g638 [Ancylostoma ceylanicum]